MIAELKQVNNGYIATFERPLDHSVGQVWAMLTDNEKLKEWFSELLIEDLREGGVIKFDMQDGTFEEMKILELKMESVLEFTWDKDAVRFELYPKQVGCLLLLKEKMNTMTDHTPRDLAGWHVCLDVIQALLAGKSIEDRKADWEKWYPKYVQVIKEVTA
ncbi:SRPBCC family protein [Lederbergia lenta]|uniref:SRPBCC family protein n=1 Tax=Lederbergia lenta TaxID=1467 RepID=UPI00203EF3FE|nr:SRPBCC family protein [Lederbergia lenta]MCM3112738.1 SRPBCC family protein [Lederbergia lenta]